MVSRRDYLHAVSGAALASLAGCTGLPLAGGNAGDDEPVAVVESRNVHPRARFGASVAVDDDLLVAGAPAALTRARTMGGTAFVYEHDGDWHKQARLRPDGGDLPGPSADERRLSFGAHAAAVDGTLVVGSAEWPVACVYERSGAGWRRAARLRPDVTEAAEKATYPNDPSGVSCFGTSMAFDGEVVALATRCSVDDPDATVETVHAFAARDHEWREVAALQRETPRTWDQFGAAIAVRDGTLAVGGVEGGGDDRDHRQVVVRLYERGGDGWTEQTRLRPDSMHWYGDRASDALALAEDALAVGDGERVAVFERDGGDWTRTASLRPAVLDDDRNVDWSLALDGDALVLGAPGATVDTDVHGSAFVYEREGGDWTLQRRLSEHDAVEGGGFGSGVAVADDRIAVGGGLRREDRADQQAVFVFPR